MNEEFIRIHYPYKLNY